MISFNTKGNFEKTDKFLKKMSRRDHLKVLDKYGRRGVEALKAATPKDTGLTADSWRYEIEITKRKVQITWLNSNIAGNIPVAILIQLGHATGSGGYVYGIDYINPALKPIFDDIAEDVWMEVITDG